MGYIVPLLTTIARQATTIHVSQTHKYTSQSQMPMGSNKGENTTGDDVTVNA